MDVDVDVDGFVKSYIEQVRRYDCKVKDSQIRDLETLITLATIWQCRFNLIKRASE